MHRRRARRSSRGHGGAAEGGATAAAGGAREAAAGVARAAAGEGSSSGRRGRWGSHPHLNEAGGALAVDAARGGHIAQLALRGAHGTHHLGGYRTSRRRCQLEATCVGPALQRRHHRCTTGKRADCRCRCSSAVTGHMLHTAPWRRRRWRGQASRAAPDRTPPPEQRGEGAKEGGEGGIGNPKAKLRSPPIRSLHTAAGPGSQTNGNNSNESLPFLSAP